MEAMSPCHTRYCRSPVLLGLLALKEGLHQVRTHEQPCRVRVRTNGALRQACDGAILEVAPVVLPKPSQN